MKTHDTSDLINSSNKDKIAILIYTILQPAIAGGLNEKEAQDMYNTIMSKISELHESDNQFNDLLQDILNKWSLPIINKFGANVNNILSDGSLN